jgi:hypothetical protein
MAGGIPDTIRGLLGVETEASKREEEERERATQLWEDQLAGTPTAGDMAGFGLFGASEDDLRRNPLYGLQVARQSQLAGVNADPRLVQAQMNALQRLERIGNAGGYTDAERAEMANIQRDAGMMARSNRMAAQSQAEARGMGRGGVSMMGALQAQQGGANAASQAANNTAIAAQHALGAIESAGNLGGQIRNQGFNEASQRASAADAWNRGNTNLIMQRQQQMAGGVQGAANHGLAVTQGATGQYNANAQAAQDDQNAIFNQMQQTGQMIGSFYGMGGGGGGDDEDD